MTWGPRMGPPLATAALRGVMVPLTVDRHLGRRDTGDRLERGAVGLVISSASSYTVLIFDHALSAAGGRRWGAAQRRMSKFPLDGSGRDRIQSPGQRLRGDRSRMDGEDRTLRRPSRPSGLNSALCTDPE